MHSSPIADRLEQLRQQWLSFTLRAQARLLVWLAADGEEALIDAFLVQECEPQSAGTPDLFLQLSKPFGDAVGHGDALSEELHSLYAQASQLPVAEQAARWSGGASRGCARRVADADIDSFVAALVSLRRHLVSADSPSLLAVWLMPDQVGSWRDYLLWLQRLTQRSPSQVRFLAIDRRAAPLYAPLARVDAERVQERVCDLTLASAIEQMVAAADDGTPAGAYRKLQTACGARLSLGDPEHAIVVGARASALASAQGWPQLAAVSSMMLAAAHGAQDRPHQAIASYAHAERLGAAREAHEVASGQGPYYGTRLRLQARLGQGAALLTCRAFDHAAVAYAQSAALAHQLADTATEHDARRLAAQLGGRGRGPTSAALRAG